MEKRSRPDDEVVNNKPNPQRIPRNPLHSCRQFQSFNNGTTALKLKARQLFISGLKKNMNKPPPLGLRLQDSTIKSIRDTMNATYESTTTTTTTRNTTAPSSIPNNSPADFFPAAILKIGEYTFKATQKGTLMVGFYYVTKKLAWEIFDMDNRIKYRVEVPWQNILSMRAIVEENKPGILEIELAKVPTFFYHIGPNPRSHPQWEPAKDFTGGHALKNRKHYLGFPPGVLDRYYQKLIQSDNRLLELGQVSRPLLDKGQIEDAVSSSSLMHSTSPWAESNIESHNVGSIFMERSEGPNNSSMMRSNPEQQLRAWNAQNISDSGDNTSLTDSVSEIDEENVQEPLKGLHGYDL